MIDPALLPESGVTREELSQRAKRFADFLKREQIPLSIVGFSPDLFYFTGSIQFGYVLITAEGETVYLVKKDPERARIESPLDMVIPFSRFSEIREAVEKLTGRIPKTVGLSLDVVPTNLFLRFKDLLDRAHIVDDSKLIRSCRMLKSPLEIDQIRQGVKIYDKAIREMPNLIYLGMTEAEAEENMILSLRRHGHQGMVRMRGWNQVGLDGYLYAGKCAAVPTFIDAPLGGVGTTPAVATRGGSYRIAKDEPLVFDASPGVGGYMSDQTRTAVFGTLPPGLQAAYAVAVDMIHRFEAEAKPGDLCGGWFEKMTAMAQKAGLEDNFMGYREKRAKFVGHGIGLELNEWPIIGRAMTWCLEPGMVLAVEPKMVFPETGVVGLENDYLVTETGVSRLSVTDDIIIYL